MPDSGQPHDAERARVLAALPRLKIFPLPGAVLLPGATVPLHIFEPRYRQMTQDCADTDRVLALAQLSPMPPRPGPRPRVLPVIGVGVLTRIERLPEGRFNVLLKGVLRARILEEHDAGLPYREVVAEPLQDEPADARGSKSAEDLRRLLLALGATRNDEETGALLQLAARATDPGELADFAAAVLLESPAERQIALETLRVADRLEMVKSAAATLLARAAPTAQTKGRLLN